jgi:AcrR family transcriptional regulator
MVADGGQLRAAETRAGRADRAILEATRELLAEGGVRELTVERVAARSGVAKTTIYRRFSGKHELALAVLFDTFDSVATTEDLGDTRAELVFVVDAAAAVLGTTTMGRIMQGLVSDLAANPVLAAAFQERIVAVRLEQVAQIVERGIGRGDLLPGTNPELATELLFGPVYYRLLLSGAPLDAGLAERVVSAVLRALAPAEPT